jgi:hypothetical protein
MSYMGLECTGERSKAVAPLRFATALHKGRRGKQSGDAVERVPNNER